MSTPEEPGSPSDDRPGASPAPDARPAPDPPRAEESSGKQGLSTGAKIAIGCGGAVLVGGILAVLALGAGWAFLSDRAENVIAGVESQAEVSETLETLRREYPFQPPSDGAVTDRQARMFLEVTDAAWEEMEPWAAEMSDLGRRLEDDRAGLREMAAGFEGMGRFAESRTILAEALGDNEVSLGEYLWTGMTLVRARRAADRASGESDVAPESLELARRYRNELAEIDGTDGERPGRGVVLQLGMVWGMADGSSWRASGLDTLRGSAR